MKKLIINIFNLIKNNFFDTFLLLGFFLCLTIFLTSLLINEEDAEFGGPVAQFISGSIQKKSIHAKNFSSIKPGNFLYNLDAIWVEPKNYAKLTLYDGTEIELSEKTLIRLKLPFKRGNRGIEGKLTVIQGNVSIKKYSWSKKEKESYTKEESEEQKKLKLLEEEKYISYKFKRIYPPPKSVLYLDKKEETIIRFMWEDKFTGYIQVKDIHSNETYFKKIKEDSFLSLKIRNQSSYTWSIIDDEKRILTGPFSFDLKIINKKDITNLIRSKPINPVHIHFE